MKIAIVKYNAGNTASVVNALGRLGVAASVTDDPETLASADKVIFPGVGEASSAMAYLKERRLDDVIRSLIQPVLGICLGMQLFCSWSEENYTECLGIVPQRAYRFAVESGMKVPHMGWNQVTDLSSPLFAGIDDADRFYFVHSYWVEMGEPTTAVCEYGDRFSAALQHKNFHAVQFHPEKSGATGERVMENFLRL